MDSSLRKKGTGTLTIMVTKRKWNCHKTTSVERYYSFSNTSWDYDLLQKAHRFDSCWESSEFYFSEYFVSLTDWYLSIVFKPSTLQELKSKLPQKQTLLSQKGEWISQKYIPGKIFTLLFFSMLYIPAKSDRLVKMNNPCQHTRLYTVVRITGSIETVKCQLKVWLLQFEIFQELKL